MATKALDKYDQLQRIYDAAQKHGSDSDPDHEVGDLQDALRTCWDLLTEEQVAVVMEDESVKGVLEWSEDFDEDEDDEEE